MLTNMPKIFFCGDNHSRFDHIIAAVETHQPDAIVMLGDTEPNRPLEIEFSKILSLTQIYFIIGNHDTDNIASYRFLVNSHLAKGRIDGEVRTIAGVKIAGLGGIFRSKIWYGDGNRNVASYSELQRDLHNKESQLQETASTIERNLTNHMSSKQNAFLNNRVRQLKSAVTSAERNLLNHASTIFPDAYDKLSACKADVLVTHEAPSCHPHGFAVLDELARSLGVKIAFHGHHHDRRNYGDTTQTLGFQAYGVGFCGITDLNGNVIVPGEFDFKWS